MLNLKKEKKPSPLELAVDELYSVLTDLSPDSEEYSKVADQLVKLSKLQAELKARTRISADVAATIVANLAGILLIIGHERLHVIGTKAIGFVSRLK